MHVVVSRNIDIQLLETESNIGSIIDVTLNQHP